MFLFPIRGPLFSLIILSRSWVKLGKSTAATGNTSGGSVLSVPVNRDGVRHTGTAKRSVALARGHYSHMHFLPRCVSETGLLRTRTHLRESQLLKHPGQNAGVGAARAPTDRRLTGASFSPVWRAGAVSPVSPLRRHVIPPFWIRETNAKHVHPSPFALSISSHRMSHTAETRRLHAGAMSSLQDATEA